MIFSIAITNKNGKPLLIRNFKETTKISIEGILSGFIKLVVSNESNQTTQLKQNS
jgi:hypothetical protein